jgi:hypothetical protein
MPVIGLSQPEAIDAAKIKNSVDRILEIRYRAERWRRLEGDFRESVRYRDHPLWSGGLRTCEAEFDHCVKGELIRGEGCKTKGACQSVIVMRGL